MVFRLKKAFVYKSSVFACAAIAAVSGAFATVKPAQANEDVYLKPLISSVEDDQFGMGQVTSVSQLSDVQPTDWAFQAVQSLVERYGCIAGYPDGTFRGNRSATRYELAAALNACLDNIGDKFATKEDLEVVRALQEEFQAELATLRGRVDGLEARTATLEAQQFSTTTKLNGEAVFTAGYVVDDDFDALSSLVTNAGNVPANAAGAGLLAAGLQQVTPAENNDRPFLGNRVRLNFDTSFTGTDRLRVRLQALNIPELDGAPCGSEFCRLGIQGEDGNLIELDELNYQFKPTKNVKLKVAVVGGDYKDDVETFNPLKSSGSGALSRFFRVNPIVHRAPGDTTLSANINLTEQLDLSLMYAADGAELATADNDNIGGFDSGLFGGTMGGLAQLSFTPSEKFSVGAQYAYTRFEGNDVDITSGTSDAPTNLGDGGDSNTSQPFGDVDTITHNFGLNVKFQPSDRFIFAGWAGLTLASTEDNLTLALADDLNLVPNAGVDSSQVSLINWAANFIFPDLLVEGNRGSISVGQAPYIFDGGDLNVSDGQDPNFLIEAQYQFKVSKYIKISPGVIVVINPENTGANDPVFIPVVRTTFKF